MSTAPIPNIALATFSQVGTYTNDPLLSDGHDITSMVGNAASGQPARVRGAIVHIDRATGAVTTAVAGAATTEANAVVAENCDPTAAAVSVLVYLTGKMKADAVTWPPAGTHAAHTESLRGYGIYLESVLFRDGLTVKSAPTLEEEKDAKARLGETKKLLEKKKEEETEEDLALGVADSNWGYLTEEERQKHPELAAAKPEPAPGTEEEEDEELKKKQTPKPTPPPPPKPEPPKK